MSLFSFVEKNPSRWKPVLAGIIILFTLSGAGFTFHNGTVTWFWTEMPFIGIMLILAAFGSSKIWVDLDRLELKNKTESVLREAGKNTGLTDLLSAREIEVLSKISEGKSNKEIADELFIEVSTVKSHINKIYKTLNIKSRKEAAKAARSTD